MTSGWAATASENRSYRPRYGSHDSVAAEELRSTSWPASAQAELTASSNADLPIPAGPVTRTPPPWDRAAMHCSRVSWRPSRAGVSLMGRSLHPSSRCGESLSGLRVQQDSHGETQERHTGAGHRRYIRIWAGISVTEH